MAKKKISPKNNWGDVIAELKLMRASGDDSQAMFRRWSVTDLMPLSNDPVGESKYLENLTSENAKKRKEALKTAEEFRDAMHEVFLYIFEDTLTDEQLEQLVNYCESSANGMLSSLIAGADRTVQFHVTMLGRMYFVEKLIGESAAG